VPREGGDKAYALLRDALAETNKVGIGTFALRNKQHLAAVKPMGDALVLELMRFQADLLCRFHCSLDCDPVKSSS
jgi:DNA end-binding protein Ku